MAVTTYQELQDAIANWSNRGDLTSAIPDFIRFAELDMGQDLRLSWMEKRSYATPDGAFVALPDDYLSMRDIYWNAAQRYPLEQLSPRIINLRFPGTETGIPSSYSIQDQQIQLRPAPASDNTATIQISYYFRPAALSDSNTSNEFLVNAPDMLLAGALIHASRYMRDKESQQHWAGMYESAGARLKDAEESALYPGEISMRYDG